MHRTKRNTHSQDSTSPFDLLSVTTYLLPKDHHHVTCKHHRLLLLVFELYKNGIMPEVLFCVRLLSLPVTMMEVANTDCAKDWLLSPLYGSPLSPALGIFSTQPSEGSQQYVTVLVICISLMTNKVEHSSLCFLAIWISSFGTAR